MFQTKFFNILYFIIITHRSKKHLLKLIVKIFPFLREKQFIISLASMYYDNNEKKDIVDYITSVTTYKEKMVNLKK